MFTFQGLPIIALTIIIVFILGSAAFAYYKKDQPLLSFISIVGSVVAIVVTVLIAKGTFTTNKESESDIDKKNSSTETPEEGKAEIYIDEKSYLHYEGHTYIVLYEVTDSFSESESCCEQDGGHLAVINDESENSMLQAYLSEVYSFNVYFGLTDEGHDKEWRWVDSSPYNYTNWVEGQPDSQNGNHYAMFCQDDSGTWTTGNFSKDSNGYVPVLIEWENDLENPLGINN